MTITDERIAELRSKAIRALDGQALEVLSALEAERRAHAETLTDAGSLTLRLAAVEFERDALLKVAEVAKKRRHCMYGPIASHPASMPPHECLGCEIDRAILALPSAAGK